MAGLTPTDIFAFTCLFCIAAYLLYIVYYAIGLYDFNPLKKKMRLTPSDIAYVKTHVPGFNELGPEASEKFLARLTWFVFKKPVAYKGQVANKRTLKLLLGAAAIFLSMGMRRFKYIRSIRRVIIYPTAYISVLNRRRHVGEYNPRLRAIVFSADRLLAGFEDGSDNINLAIHEFAHALYFETKGRRNWEAKRFQWGFRKLERFHSGRELPLAELDHLREYAKTNVFELFAVLAEHYFENPSAMQTKAPTLYSVLRKMLGFEGA
ncbi:zinc-dependent peptidase [Flagellimonas sp. DF-77]|uniref:zinc-dependent peptidase n=1 Tax=Flagellimonas algarum TaxID=3230298 RepID=UPI003391FB27